MPSSFNWDAYPEVPQQPQTSGGGGAAFDWNAYPESQPSGGGLLARAGSAVASGWNNYVKPAFDAVDSYVDAPFRAGVGALESGQGLLNSAKTAYNQVGQDPSTAPSVKDLLVKAGASDNPKDSSSLTWLGEPGLALDVLKKLTGMSNAEALSIPASVAQPSTLLLEGAGPAAEVIGRGGKAAAGLLEKGAEGAADIVSKVKRNIVIKPILDSLGSAKAALDPATDGEAIAQIDKLISDAKGPGWTGKVSRPQLNAIHEMLLDHAAALPTQESADAANKAAGAAYGLMNDSDKAAAALRRDYAKKLSPEALLSGAGEWIGSRVMPENPLIGAKIGEHVAPAAVRGLLKAGNAAATSPAITRAALAGGLLNRLQNQQLLSK